jgi:hypothetical protein
LSKRLEESERIATVRISDHHRFVDESSEKVQRVAIERGPADDRLGGGEVEGPSEHREP